MTDPGPPEAGSGVDPQPVAGIATAAGDEGPRVRACFFRLGDRRFAALDRDCEEVVEISALTRLPCAPRHVLGVAHAHGRVLAVIDIREALGAAPRASGLEATQALVLAHGEYRAAAVIDQVLGFEAIEEEDLLPAAALDGLPVGVALGGVRYDGRDVPVLDAERLLAALAIAAAEPIDGVAPAGGS